MGRTLDEGIFFELEASFPFMKKEQIDSRPILDQ